jgi:tetratricopeptide (TPR) repeat protein
MVQYYPKRGRAQVSRARSRARAELDALADDDDLDGVSNAVIHLVRAGKLDEAEAAARDLLARFPQVHDGYDRLGMVYEARGDKQQAALYYRKVVEFARQRPNDYDPKLADNFQNLADRLDPPAGT